MMEVLERETFVPRPRRVVFAFFGDPSNLARITPRSLGFEIIDAPRRTLRRGDHIRYRIRVLGIPIGWTTLISDWESNAAVRRRAGARPVQIVATRARAARRARRHAHARPR